MPGLVARIGVYVIAAGIVFDNVLHYLGYFSDFEYHFPFGGLFSPFLLPIGIVLIVASGFVRLSAKSDAPKRIALTGSKTAGFEVADTLGCESIRPRRWPLRPRFTSLPSRGLISFSLAVPLIIAMWIHVVVLPSKGIWIFAPNISNRPLPEPGANALVLRIDSRKRYYFDSKLISHGELADALVRGLAQRAERVVYVDGNPNLDFQDIVDVIDTIRGVHANVVLLTPPIKPHRR